MSKAGFYSIPTELAFGSTIVKNEPVQPFYFSALVIPALYVAIPSLSLLVPALSLSVHAPSLAVPALSLSTPSISLAVPVIYDILSLSLVCPSVYSLYII